jgi:hypothetical protein
MICIPSSVTIICAKCFSGCSRLFTVAFEDHSKLLRLDESAFSDCPCLAEIFIPASIEHLFQSYQSLVTHMWPICESNLDTELCVDDFDECDYD